MVTESHVEETLPQDEMQIEMQITMMMALLLRFQLFLSQWCSLLLDPMTVKKKKMTRMMEMPRTP